MPTIPRVFSKAMLGESSLSNPPTSSGTVGKVGVSERERDPRAARKHLTPRQRSKVKAHLDKKGPRRCAFEGPDCKGSLELDHINDNPRDNRYSNFQWICPSHNRRKKSLVSVSEREISSARVPAVDASDNLVPTSERMQRDLEGWLWKKLGPTGPHKYLPESTIEKEAGFDCNISPVTIHRYLVKPGPMTASNARWRLVDKYLPGDRPERKTLCVMWRGHKILPQEIDVTDH